MDKGGGFPYKKDGGGCSTFWGLKKELFKGQIRFVDIEYRLINRQLNVFSSIQTYYLLGINKRFTVLRPREPPSSAQASVLKMPFDDFQSVLRSLSTLNNAHVSHSMENELMLFFTNHLPYLRGLQILFLTASSIFTAAKSFHQVI